MKNLGADHSLQTVVNKLFPEAVELDKQREIEFYQKRGIKRKRKEGEDGQGIKRVATSNDQMTFKLEAETSDATPEKCR